MVALPASPSDSVAGISSGEPAMRYSSLAQAPKSINLQRSEQNGRYALSGEKSDMLPHCGHLTFGGLRGGADLLLESFMVQRASESKLRGASLHCCQGCR